MGIDRHPEVCSGSDASGLRTSQRRRGFFYLPLLAVDARTWPRRVVKGGLEHGISTYIRVRSPCDPAACGGSPSEGGLWLSCKVMVDCCRIEEDGSDALSWICHVNSMASPGHKSGQGRNQGCLIGLSPIADAVRRGQNQGKEERFLRLRS